MILTGRPEKGRRFVGGSVGLKGRAGEFKAGYSLVFGKTEVRGQIFMRGS